MYYVMQSTNMTAAEAALLLSVKARALTATAENHSSYRNSHELAFNCSIHPATRKLTSRSALMMSEYQPVT